MDLPERLTELLTFPSDRRLLQYKGAWVDVGAVRRWVAELDKILSDAGFGAGTEVALITRNRPPHVAAILALLSTRRCLVPITSIQSGAATIADIGRTGAPVVLAETADWASATLLKGCAEAGLLAVALPSTESSAEIVGRPESRKHAKPARGTAVLMPTSGTTGLPKRIPYLYEQLGGALGRVAAYSPATARALGDQLRPRHGVVIASLTLAHVAGFWTLLQALTEGRSLVLLDRFEPEEWADAVEEHHVGMAMIPPTTISMVLDAGIATEKLRSLKAIVCGTAPLDPAVGDAFTATYRVPVLTAYGATEFPGGIVGWSLADYERFHDAKPASAGRARPGIKIRIVDADTGSEVPTGNDGLISVLSPQATTRTEDGWVRTNDLGRLDEDGFLYVLGRADDAINRGGFKIVPQVVEAELRQHPSVVDAALVGVPDRRLGQLPVAAVTVREPVSESELLEWLRSRVTKYQVPAEIRIYADLPRTASLKISKEGVRALFEATEVTPAHN
jgi:acyl-coenzyme A synthetase/AMP-(fatty) acid ligase